LQTVDEKNPPTAADRVGEPRVEMSISVLTLPEGWGVELPEGVHKRTAFAAFDKTYKMEGGVLTTERRVEILKPKVWAAEWASYKKWRDAIDLGSETYVQLVSVSGKAEAGAPPVAGSNAAEAARMVQEAYEEIQRGEVNKAQGTLDAAQKRNAKQEYMWSTYGYMEFQRQRFEAAIGD
jgi:hypothetical protein